MNLNKPYIDCTLFYSKYSYCHRIIMFVACLLPSILFSQSIEGVLVDEQNQPLPYAHVLIKKSIEASFAFGTVSDSLGGFLFENLSSGEYDLLFTYIGYSNDTLKGIEVKDGIAISIGAIKLIPTFQQLEGVTITGKKPVIERKIDRIIYNVENNEAVVGKNALDILQVMPRVKVQSEQISIIGKGNVLLMIDDRPISMEVGDAITYLQNLSSTEIKQIEVITTPPSKYISEGNSGIINIKLQKAKENSWKASFNTLYVQSKYARGGVGGDISVQKGKFSFFSQNNYHKGHYAVYSNSKFFYNEGLWDEENSRKDGQNFFKTNTGLSYEFNSKWSIGGLMMGVYSNPDDKSKGITKIYNSENTKVDSVIKTNAIFDRRYFNNGLNLYSQYTFGEGKVLDITWDMFKIKESKERNFATTGILSALNNGNKSAFNQSISIDMQHATDWIELNYGFRYSYLRNDNDFNFFETNTEVPLFIDSLSNIFKYSEHIQAIYLSGYKELNDFLEMELGIRIENTIAKGNSIKQNLLNKNRYIVFFPTFYLGYYPSDNHTINLNYGKRINRPPYYKIDPFRWYNNAFSYSEGNPFLTPSYTHNVEIEYIFKNSWTSTFYVSHNIDGFEFIDIVTNDNRIQASKPFNFFNTTTIGISEYYTIDKLKWLTSTFGFDWYWSKSKSLVSFNNQLLKGSNAYISTNQDFLLNKKKTFFLGISYWYNFKGTSDLDKATGYGQLDFSLKCLLLDKKLLISLMAQDIFRTNQPVYTNFVNDIKTTFTGYNDNRQIRLRLSYSFGNRGLNIEPKEIRNKEERDRIN